MIDIHKKTFNIRSSYVGSNYDEVYDKEGNYIGRTIKEDHFEVEDIIALPIQALNRKGYITEFCCAGHLFEMPDAESYISFKEGIWLPSLPPGWHEDEEKFQDTKLAIRYSYDKYNDGASDGFMREFLPKTYKDVDDFPAHRFNGDYDFKNAYVLIRKFQCDRIELMEQLYKWALDLPDFTMKNQA